MFKSRKLRQARLVLDRFLRHQSNHVDGLVTRARVLAKLGSRDLAARDFTRALSITLTREPELYLERASVLAGEGHNIAEHCAASTKESSGLDQSRHCNFWLSTSSYVAKITVLRWRD